MYLTFRWYGPDDPVPLAYIRQIPGMKGIVHALHDLPPGALWPLERLEARKDEIEAAGLRWAVVESLPVHEDIKLGRAARDRLIEAYCRSIEHVGRAGIGVVCYNFMPVFDWMRTDLAQPRPDGSTTLAYDYADLDRFDLSQGLPQLPAWAATFSADELQALLHAYRAVDAERLWDHLGYFLERVVPAAAEAGVVLGLHPDDPPWPIFGLPRIVTEAAALQRVVALVDHPANGLTFCTGSLGADPANDLPAMVRHFGGRGRIHFAHCRNVRVTAPRRFYESAHPSALGDVDLFEVMRAYHAVGFQGPMRPDHGRMIWGEAGTPGYGLYDRALGATYLAGLWEALERTG